MRIFLLFCLMPVIVFAQSYFETSGQTVAFALTPGAKASWNQGVAVEKALVKPSLDVFRIFAVGNGLFVKNVGRGTIKVFDVRGRMTVRLSIEHDGFVPLSQKLSNGLYVAWVEAHGVTRATTLAVIR